MRISVDPAACDGFGYCAELVPELMALDEWGFPVVSQHEVPGELLDAASQAARACPRRALLLAGPSRRS
jgi:ferredoxin